MNTPRKNPILTHVARLALSLSVAHCGATQGEPGVDGGMHHPDTGGSVPLPDAGANPPQTDDACTPPVPTQHRPTHAVCPAMRGPGPIYDASAPDSGILGACTSDSQCTTGKNGRCLIIPPRGNGSSNQVPTCSYDACTEDSDCGNHGICVCRSGGDSQGANTCLGPNQCAVDSDCGEGGTCSPSFDTTCGSYDGVVGYFCHKPADQCGVDECTNDGDCGKGSLYDGGSPDFFGYCAWSGEASHWVCAYAGCSG